MSAQIGKLRPSRELLEYYRKKIAEYDDEHDELVSKLEEYRVTYEEQVKILMYTGHVFLLTGLYLLTSLQVP